MLLRFRYEPFGFQLSYAFFCYHRLILAASVISPEQLRPALVELRHR